MSDEAVGELVFPVEHADHLEFVNEEHGGWCNRGRSRYGNGLTCKATFPKKIARSQNGHNGFFAGLIDHRKLHTAFLNVHDILRGIALREHGFFRSKLGYLSSQTCRVEKLFHIENTVRQIRLFLRGWGAFADAAVGDIRTHYTIDFAICSLLNTRCLP